MIQAKKSLPLVINRCKPPDFNFAQEFATQSLKELYRGTGQIESQRKPGYGRAYGGICAGVARLREEMDLLLRLLRTTALGLILWEGKWTPAMNVAETEDQAVMKAKVPGSAPKDIRSCCKTPSPQLLVILSGAKNLVFSTSYRSFTPFRMTEKLVLLQLVMFPQSRDVLTVK
jgi:hypothetical protein